MKSTHRARWLATLLALPACSLLHAEMLDEVDLRREGNHAVVQIRLSTPVSVLRTTASRTRDLTQAYYQLRLTDIDPGFVAGERRIVKVDGLPVITISDEPVRTDKLDDINRRLVISFSQAGNFKVRAGKGDRSIEVVLEGLGSAVKPITGKAQEERMPSQRYVIALARSADPKLEIDAPIPQSLQNYQVFTARRVVDGKQVHEMDLGYFSTLAEAEAAMKQLSRFPAAVIVKLGDATASKASAPGQATAPAATADQQARDLLDQSRQAYEQQKPEEAIRLLNQLLDLPATAVTPDAQELLGMVRLSQGEQAKAQAEFESYLKQYPSGPGAERVKGLLAGIQPADLKLVPTIESIKTPEGAITTTGSISQYYYGGKSTTATQAVRDTDGTLLSADEINNRSKAPISTTDQRLLSTNVDTTWRSRDADRDIKLVFRDQFDYNMLSDAQLKGKSRDRNRLNAAYFDYQGLKNGLRGRLGRQSAMWGGEGRYDGASGSYAFRPKWKVSAAAGQPTDKLGAAKRQFFGTSIDADALTPNMGASLFVLQRNIDGEVDRRATGADLRYFTQSSSLMASTDYDVIFKKINVVSLQGTYTAEDNTTVLATYERRSLAPASLSQTLFFQYQEFTDAGIIPQTITDLKNRGYTVDQLRELVRANTSYWTHSMLSVTTPVSPQWQTGATLDFNRTGAIAPNAVLPQGQAASGLSKTLSLLAIGSNLYSARDTNVFTVSLMRGKQIKTYMLNYNNMTPLTDTWQLEPGLRWQRNISQDTTTGLNITTVAWGPGLKASFKPRPSVTLESNLNVDYTRTEGVANNDQSTRYTYFLGYRYDY
ncbi:MAG: tetratricopeptide repeat protein [Aquabacterium sp.]|uniref:tetratricopeptide repeat protein n=1 Tax=Aquabacterium sp. TaxID=1872578 RepID=UPI0025B86AF6|nr:tetratricopeptide repeat protein [Aquabacterium sp.]MBI5925961.1 tetratricopeptide repeat protein [Aquabacterium sp.]